jgi:hypothetical protein
MGVCAAKAFVALCVGVGVGAVTQKRDEQRKQEVEGREGRVAAAGEPPPTPASPRRPFFSWPALTISPTDRRSHLSGAQKSVSATIPAGEGCLCMVLLVDDSGAS